LLNDDHPQYLRTDGTRQLTGNMLVAAGITIDGVDISAAETANAAHRTSTSNPHSVTAAQVGAATTGALAAHTGDTNNPHNVTTTQIGAATVGALSAHTGNTSNPHSVTAAQVGAVPVARTVSTSGAATGGGALSADITISVAADAAQGTTSTRQIGTTTPGALGGTATAGTSLAASAADHVHPIVETSGPTTLTIGAVADGEYVRRVGTALVGGTPSGGGSGGYGILPAAATAVALWRFDGNLNDDSGNGITITAAAGTPQYERGPNGRGGVIFENSGRLTATNALLAPSGASGTISVEMLFRSGAFNNQNILGVLTAGFASINYNIVMETTGLVYYTIDGGGFFDFRCNRRVPMDGLFHHVVVTREVTGGNTNLAWFIDGQACGTVTRAQLPSGAAGNTLTIMNNPDNSGAVTFPSALGGLAIHNAVLSPATILSRARVVLPSGYI
jgi:hypothetical protein